MSNKSLESLFGKPITTHKVVLRIPKKMGKNDSNIIANQIHEYFVSWFVSCITSEEISTYKDGKGFKQENNYVLTSYFSESQLKHLVDLQALIKGIIVIFNYDGLLLEIDNEIYFVKE